MLEHFIVASIAGILGFILAALCSASHQQQAEGAGSEMYLCLQEAIKQTGLPDGWYRNARLAMQHWLEA